MKKPFAPPRRPHFSAKSSKNRASKNQYLHKEKLIRQLIEIIGQTNINEANIRRQFDEGIQRIGKFNKVFLGRKNAMQQETDFDARSYAKYVLNEGAPTEKREPLGMLRGKLVVKNKVIYLEK